MKSNRFILIVILLMILSSACNLPGMSVPTATVSVTDVLPIEASETPAVPALVETATPQIVFDGKLTCTPTGTFTKCLDGLLRIEYEYPTDWGVLSANLQSGNEAMTGSAYDYQFDGKQFGDSAPLVAGGRSKDFSAGRGGIPTDFWGYIPGDPDRGASCTAGWHQHYALCENVNPNLAWMISFPDAAALCLASGGPGFSLTPVFRIEINLPDNPTIHGFVWEVPFVSGELSNQLNNDLYPLLGANVDMVTKCDAESQQKFDAQRAVYLDQFKNNATEVETQEKLDQIHHLVESIIFH